MITTQTDAYTIGIYNKSYIDNKKQMKLRTHEYTYSNNKEDVVP